MATVISPEHSDSRLEDLLPSASIEERYSGEVMAPVGATGDFVVRAVARHKLLVLITGALFALAGIAVGVARKPVFTASSTLQVGTVNLNSPNFYGFVQSASDLATVFSRSITAAPVLADLRSELGVGPAEATQRLSAEPIPLSPSFRVIATGSSAAGAVNLANAASEAVIAYETHAAGSTSPPTDLLLRQYVHAAQALQRISASATRLAHTRRQFGVGEDSALIAAQSEVDAARLHVTALGAAYQSALVSAGANPPTGVVSLVAGAVTASSDRRAKIELLGFLGMLAGLVLGAALATVYERRRVRPRSG